MKQIFYWLLKTYGKTEKGRVDILRILAESVNEDYNEQTVYGNVYNYFKEWVLANQYIVNSAIKKDECSLDILKSGIEKSFVDAINMIEVDQNKNRKFMK